MMGVVLLNVLFLVVEQTKRVQQLLAEGCDVLAGCFDVLHRHRSTGAYSAI